MDVTVLDLQFEAAILDKPLVVIRLFFGEAEIGDVASYESLVQGSPIGYTNPKVTALLKELRVAFNPNEEDRIYRELWPIFQADLHATFLYREVDTTVAHRRVRGLSSPYRAEPFRHMDDLWLEDEP